MKKASLIFLPLFLLTILLASCNDQATQTTGKTPSTETPKITDIETTSQSQQKDPGLSIYQINNDGTSQLIMGGEKDSSTQNNVGIGVVPGLKGMAITSTGFTPSELTIAVGTKVRFENIDNAPHWPASDPHPTHDLCPGFAADKALAKGDFYEFTFDKPETCTFHDHLNPTNDTFKGKIIVK
jgi:plastocyanin